MFKPGDIVTDVNPENVFYEKQGQVVCVQLRFWEEPEVWVMFGRTLYPYSLPPKGGDDRAKFLYFQFEEKDLKLEDGKMARAYHAMRKAQTIFGEKWHSLELHRNSLDQTKKCMENACGSKQTEEVLVNVWGTVRNVFLCEHHAVTYRKYPCMDAFLFDKSTGT